MPHRGIKVRPTTKANLRRHSIWPPEFDTKRAKLLIYIDRVSRLPLQQAQLGVLLGFFDFQCGQHIGLALGY